MSNLGGFSDEALKLFQLAASERGYDDFSEGDIHDFTRCVRPDGTAYGTSGSCKKGSSAPVAPVPPKERNPKAKKPKWNNPHSVQNALNRHIKNHPEVMEHMNAWRQHRGNLKTAEAEMKRLKKEGDEKGAQAAAKRADQHEREMERSYDRAGKAAKKAEREFNKEHGIKKSPEERALEKEMKLRG